MPADSIQPRDADQSRNTGWWYRAVLLARKELRETLRDRRTIITLLAMPLLLYPLLGMVFRFLAVSQMKKTTAPQYVIAVGTDVEALWLSSALDVGMELQGWTRKQSADREASGQSPTDDVFAHESPESTAAENSFFNSKFRILAPNDEAAFDLVLAVAGGDADLGVSVRMDDWNGTVELLQPAEVRLLSNVDSAISREALQFVGEQLQAANLLYAVEAARHYDPRLTLPVRVTQDTVSSAGKSRGFLGLLPLVLLLMTVTGGVYPAIDLTAGERERDTLETLIALPIPTVHLLLAKYVAVFSVTLLTGLMNIVAMSATVYSLRMETQLFGDSGLTGRLAVSLILILVVFGLFYSAVLLALTSSSRSFKEAQAYLIPLMLMSIAPGMVILLPGWQLEGVVSVAPIVNMLLLARDVFEGTASGLPATAAVLSTLFYAACALTVAARVFGTDAVAVGSRGTWSDLWRRPASAHQLPSLTTALVTLGMLFPLYFFAHGLLSRTADANPQVRLITSGILTALIFGAFPFAVTIWQRLNLNRSWQLQLPIPAIWPVAIILGLGTWPWIYELVLATSQLGIVQLDEQRMQQVARILERWRSVPLPLMVLSLGVIPGVFEELFFRGFLLSSLRPRCQAWQAVLICGLTFGIFHVIASEGAAIERLLPSSVLGILLSWLAVRTNSVLPGILLHVLHNSSLLVIAHFRDDLQQLTQLTVAGSQQEHLPAAWLAASAIAILVAIGSTWQLTRSQPTSHAL